MAEALAGIRICDFTGQLAGAGATKWLAAFGAEVIRIEDPTRQGRWDILRGAEPFIDERRGIDLGCAFNNHNTGKLGITLNLKTEAGKEILAELVKISDAVTENFAKGVLERWGFGYDALKALKSDIIYVSNCGFGHAGPYSDFKTWGPIVQAVSGLTFSSGQPDHAPAGWGFSYMNHTGGYYMAMAILAALLHRERTGEGQWVDMACTETALTLNGPSLLDWTANGRPMRRPGQPNSNRSQFADMAPHGIYPCDGEDQWIAIACRHDDDWNALANYIQQPWTAPFDLLDSRLTHQDELDRQLSDWTCNQEKFALQQSLRDIGIPVSAVQTPGERIEQDSSTNDFDLWPTVQHTAIGKVRVDGYPVHLSKTDWLIEQGGPCLGEHTVDVLTRLLGMTAQDLEGLHEDNVI